MHIWNDEGVDPYISIEVYVGNGLCAVPLNVKFLNHISILEQNGPILHAFIIPKEDCYLY